MVKDEMDRFHDPHPFHRPEVDRGGVVDPFRDRQRSLDDVRDVRVPFGIAQHELIGLELPDVAYARVENRFLAPAVGSRRSLREQALCVRCRNRRSDRADALDLKPGQHRG